MVYIFFADGFEELEALAPVDVLRRAGIEVRMVGVTGEMVRGRSGIEVKTEITPKEVDLADAEMLVLPGGGGYVNLENSETVIKLVRDAYAAGRYVAAICAAPSILGRMGLLRGRKATCFPGFESALEGATYTGDPVCVDGKIITARGPGVAVDFALSLIEALRGKETATKIRAEMQCV